MLRRTIIAFLALIAATLIGVAPAVAQALIEENTFLSVEIEGKPYRLEVLIVRPAGVAGRLPIAILTHGKNFADEENAAKRANDLLAQSRDFAYRGWLVVSVVRRGFGLSQGQQARQVDCVRQNFHENFERNADDLAAVLAVIAKRPDVDPRRVIAVGVSAGGATALALAARRPPGLLAVINVSGGLQLTRGGTPCAFEPGLIAAFAKFGGQSQVPTLWLYADNDRLFRPELIRALHAAYQQAGGQADLTLFGPIDDDGHKLWSAFNGRKQWLPVVDRFLTARALPTWDRARVSKKIDAARVSPGSRQVVEDYLAAPTQKVLVISQSSRRAFWWAGGDLADMRKRSLESCEMKTAERCVVVVENFEVLGTEFQAGPLGTPRS